jgi:adenosylcobinamide-phosphate synthase
MIKTPTLLAACALDWLAGDPRWLPHPVRLMGKLIVSGERIARRFTSGPGSEFIAGVLLSVLVVVASSLSARALIGLMRRAHPRLGVAAEVTLAWTTLAMRSLITEASGVVAALDAGDLQTARARLSGIVGRDTAHLDEREVSRAVIETVAESACDGIMAPLFYLAVGGVPVAFVYKAVNTLDSMIGHREPPYLYFGRFAARTDDVANYLPARVAAFAITASGAMIGADPRAAWRVWQRDGACHASPNAGRPEAAMAGLLRVRLGGVNYYDGEAHQAPHFGAEFETPSPKVARRSLRVALVASLIGCAAAFAVCCLGKVSRQSDS